MNPRLCALLAVAVSCSPPLPTTDVTPAEPEAVPEGTWAGKTSDENTLVALVSGGGRVQVYFCDGQDDLWLRGTVSSPTARLDGDEGTVSFDLFRERAFGELRRADGTSLAFDVPRDEGQPLFRAEDSVGGDVVLGGWIRLPDGTQRGLVRVGGAVNTSSLLVNNSALQGALCPQCGSAGPLQPVAFTPASLGDVRTNLPRRFTYAALGESYISGEGSPVDAGGPFTHDGMLEANATQEFWGDGLPRGLDSSFLPDAARARIAREARACHRSDAAASVLARAELARRWAGVSFAHVSFACSGAQVPQLVDARDTGSADCDQKSGTAKTECYQWADDLPEAQAVPPQLEQLDDFTSTWRTSVDGVVMSIGGNDMGFGLVIEDCLKGDCTVPGAAGPEAFSRGQNGLPARWRTLQQALAARRVSPSRVALIAYPNPLRKTESAACAPDDYPGDELILKEVTLAEANAAFDIHRRMNQTTAALAADAGWAVEAGHVNQTPGHAMCNGDDAWFNTTTRALRTQGVDLPPIPVPVIGPFRVSTGMVHPNAKGHREMYLPSYLSALDRMVAQKFKPASPTRFRVVSSSRANGQLEARLAWDDRSPSETHFRVTAEGLPTFMQTVSADTAGATVTLNAVAAGREVTFQLEACFTSHRTLCSEPVFAMASTQAPEDKPTGLVAGTALGLGVTTTWSLTWSEVPSRRHAFYTVELVTSSGSVSRKASERASLVMSPTQATHFRVASCNAIGCGPAADWVKLPASSGPSVQVCPNGTTAPAFGSCTSGLSR
ncbi:MAG: hypothetical protein IAE78_29110 [Myxococcus sp.]|nr:hypothetical protein [Myxococcus sp.]